LLLKPAKSRCRPYSALSANWKISNFILLCNAKINVKALWFWFLVNNRSSFQYSREGATQVAARIGFVKFLDANDVNVALHMCNTVFIDRALIVTPYSGSRFQWKCFYFKTNRNKCFVLPLDELPDEFKALEILNTVNGHGVMEPKMPASLTNQVYSAENLKLLSKCNAWQLVFAL
jgi:hypothetical protein